MKRLFHGGVHPADQKDRSAGLAPIPAPFPAQVTIPLLQHIGAPCQPLVRPGESVKLGQKIGDGPGLCVPVHASVSGRVLAIEPRPYPSGEEVLSVVLENDFLDTPSQTLEPHPDPSALSGQQLLHIIREAGIAGMGGAAFSTHVKAQSGLDKIDTLIANACECEPYITADDSLLCTYPQQVLDGIRLMSRILRPRRMVLALEDNKHAARSVLSKCLEQEPALELKVLPTRYPQGAEKQLIQAVTGRQVPPGQLPSAVGCGVFNVATFASVYRAVVLGQPLTHRIVTVTGEGVRAPMNLYARIGTPFSQLIEAAGGLTEDVCKVLSGGPMMGIAQSRLDVPVLKGTNAILCLTRQEPDIQEDPVCIRCGRCVAVCPVHLQPLYLYRYQRSGDLPALERLNLSDCIECGCCSYTCPGKLPLVERLRAGKRALKEKRNP